MTRALGPLRAIVGLAGAALLALVVPSANNNSSQQVGQINDPRLKDVFAQLSQVRT
jgi:hypothetical protein